MLTILYGDPTAAKLHAKKLFKEDSLDETTAAALLSVLYFSPSTPLSVPSSSSSSSSGTTIPNCSSTTENDFIYNTKILIENNNPLVLGKNRATELHKHFIHFTAMLRRRNVHLYIVVNRLDSLDVRLQRVAYCTIECHTELTAIATIKDLRDTKTDTRSILIEKNPRVIKNVLEKEKW